MHFYNILTVGQFSRKLSHIVVDNISYAHSLYCNPYWNAAGFYSSSYLSLHVSWAFEAQTNSGSMVNRHMKNFQYIEGASLHFKPPKNWFSDCVNG